MRIQRIAIAAAVCILLGFVWSMLPDRAEAARKPLPMCNNVTAAAVFRDAQGDGIRSDRLPVYASPLYGSQSEYHGWEDSLVCLMENDDWDFIMGTTGTSFEKNGWDRMVTLDFGNQQVPFTPSMIYEVLIRADYIYNIDQPGPVSRRLIVWFTANRVDYKLYFDDNDLETNMVQVTLSGTAPNQVWTIVSSGKGRLEGPRKVGVVGYYLMPFQIKIYETSQPKTCL